MMTWKLQKQDILRLEEKTVMVDINIQNTRLNVIQFKNSMKLSNKI